MTINSDRRAQGMPAPAVAGAPANMAEALAAIDRLRRQLAESDAGHRAMDARATTLEVQRDEALAACDQVDRLLVALGKKTSGKGLIPQIRAIFAEPESASTASEPKVPCADGFHWIGQSFTTCDRCGELMTHVAEVRSRHSMIDIARQLPKWFPIAPLKIKSLGSDGV